MNEVEKGKIYRIKDLIIEVPEMEDTKRYMKINFERFRKNEDLSVKLFFIYL